MNATEICDCTLRLANGDQPICDGSGVIAITDIPESRVVVCPWWPVDADEPLAYWEAREALGYDAMPASMQERIRTNLVAQVPELRRQTFADRHAPYLNGPADDTPPIVSADFLAAVNRARDAAHIAALVLGAVAAVAFAVWMWTR